VPDACQQAKRETDRHSLVPAVRDAGFSAVVVDIPAIRAIEPFRPAVAGTAARRAPER
jgi:hypothetical protein